MINEKFKTLNLLVKRILIVDIKSYFKSENIFVVILFVWILSIPFKNFLYQISTIFLIIFFLFYIIKSRDFKLILEIFIKYKDLIYIFIFIIFTMCISNILNFREINSWEVIFKFILRYGFIFFILIYFYIRDIFNKKLMLFFIVFSLSIQLFSGIYQSIFVFDISNSYVSNRIRGFTFHSNNYSFLMGIGFLVMLSLIKNMKMTLRNILCILLLLLFGYVLLLTYSRAAWLGILVALFIYFVYKLKDSDIKTILVLILLLSIIFIVISNIDVLNHRFKSILNGDSSGRVNAIWLPAINLIKEKFIFGYGLGLEAIKNYNLIIYKLGGFHNVTIEIFFHIGFLGFLSFLFLLLQIMKEIYKEKNLMYGLILAFIMIDSQFDQSIFLGKPYLSTLTIFMFYVFSERFKKINKEL